MAHCWRLVGLALAGLLLNAALPQAVSQRPSRHTPPAARKRTPPNAGGQGQRALSVQVFLDRAGFSPGEIDGRSGANTQEALAAYQRYNSDRGERTSPSAISKTAEDQDPPVVSYTITGEDVAGPFTPDIPSDLLEQAKLPALGYRSPLELLSERFHASPELLRSLNPGAAFNEGTQIQVPNVAREKTPPAAVERVVVSAAHGSLTAFEPGGRVAMFAPVTSGSEHDPLPIGHWKVTSVEHDPVFHYNPDLFWDADPSHSKTKLPPGPNGPVGTVWIGLDKPHYGIHGTAEPSTIGRTASHGCVRLTNWDAERLASLVKVGTPVIFEP